MMRPFINTALNTEGKVVATFHIIHSLPIATVGILKKQLSMVRMVGELAFDQGESLKEEWLQGKKVVMES